jgi:multiple sugar transport system substrate-binding protein
MKQRDRFYIVLAVLVVVATILTVGCAEKGPVTVKFMSSDADLPADWVAKFNEENPDIQIVRTEPDYAKMVAEAAAGTASDLLNLGSGSDIAYYVPRGLFKDMTPFFEKSSVIKMDDIDRLGNAEYQFDGKEFGKGAWYGLSKDYNNIGAITYNKEMFKAAGIPFLSETEPITYDELYELAKKLTVKDASGKVVTWGYDYGTGWWKFLASDMAYMAGVSFYADADKTKMNDDPRLRDIWKFHARMFLEDLVPNVKNPAPGWAGANFQSDRVAMVQLGYWYGAQLRTNPGFEEKYGWAPTPVLTKGGPRVTNTLGATGVVMYAKTKVPDEAFKVFEWYMGGGYGQERARTGWGIPPLKSLASLLPAENAFDKSRKAIALDDAKYFKPWQTCPWITGPSWDVAWTTNIEPLVRGEIDMDQFVDRYYADLNKAFAEGKAQVGQ